MIEYNIRQILLTLLKKWYIILLMGVVFGAVSVPLANISYERALKNYEILHVAESRTFCEIYSYGDTADIDLYVDILKNIEIMDEVCTENGAGQEWSAFADKIEVQIESTVNVMTIVVADVDKSIKSLLNTAIEEWVPKYLSSELGTDISIQKLEKENVNAAENMGAHDEIVSMLIKEPVRPQNTIGIIFKACILGVAISCMCIMIWDYLNKCKSME